MIIIMIILTRINKIKHIIYLSSSLLIFQDLKYIIPVFVPGLLRLIAFFVPIIKYIIIMIIINNTVYSVNVENHSLYNYCLYLI